MSIKIYNGTRIPAMSNVSLMKFLKSLQLKFDKAVQENIHASIVRLGVLEYDKRTLGLTDTKETVYTIVDRHMTKQYMDKGHWSSTKTEVAIFPLKNKILTIFYDEREYEKIWTTAKGVKFYGFWNNTDEDKECSAKEWKQRGKDWDSVLTGDDPTGVPALDGLGFQFTSENLFMYTFEWVKENMIKHVPDMKIRLDSVAEAIVDKDVKKDATEIMSYLTSDDRKKKILEKTKELNGKLDSFKVMDDIFRKTWQ